MTAQLPQERLEFSLCRHDLEKPAVVSKGVTDPVCTGRVASWEDLRSSGVTSELDEGRQLERL